MDSRLRCQPACRSEHLAWCWRWNPRAVPGHQYRLPSPWPMP